MTRALRRLGAAVALASLGVLALMLAVPVTPLGLSVAAPLLLMLLAGLLDMPRWPLLAAILLLPYFAYGVMDVLTNPAGRMRAIIFAVLTIIGFFAAMDRLRRN